jgi:hypothetical protein
VEKDVALARGSQSHIDRVRAEREKELRILLKAKRTLQNDIKVIPKVLDCLSVASIVECVRIQDDSRREGRSMETRPSSWMRQGRLVDC